MKHTDPNIIFEKFQNFYNKSFITEEDHVQGKNNLGELSKIKKKLKNMRILFVVVYIFSKTWYYLVI